MSRPEPLAVSVSTVIAAPPGRVYDLISDVSRMGKFSPETRSAAWLDGASAPAVGARFRGRNAIGVLRWTTTPTVTAADPGLRFAFAVPGPSHSHWSYDLEATADGRTRVTESMRQTTAQPLMIRILQRIAGVADRAEHLRSGMSATLAQLAAAAEVRDNALDPSRP